MQIEYLQKMDRIIRTVGSRDPDEILACMGFIYIDPGENLSGFITKTINEHDKKVHKK